MTSTRWKRGLVTAGALLLGLAVATSSWAQNMFYREVEKDGRLYVFAVMSSFEVFEKSGEMGKGITRLGYGPSGQTVMFDSEDAINLYNFKHNLPGEVFPKPKEVAKSPFPAGKFSGLMFGDYYWYEKYHQDQISATNPNYVQGQQGFWMRRIYFTYDLAFNEKFTTRFRLEANSNGTFLGGNLVPFVKDAYLKWTYTGKQQLTVGIQPTLTFDFIEAFWGLRHIEKTPDDLYRIDSSRDFALTFSGPIAALNHLNYGGQFGNDSGNSSDTDRQKILRLEGRYDANPGIALEGFYSHGDRPSGQDRTTWQGFGGYRNKAFRAAAQYTWQERKSGKFDVLNQTIDIWSAFAIWEFKEKKADVFGRVDWVKGEVGPLETGLPGADGIDYWLLSPKVKFTNYLFGLELFLIPSIRFSPNIDIVKYDKAPDPIKFPGRDEDRVYRLTFFWTF